MGRIVERVLLYYLVGGARLKKQFYSKPSRGLYFKWRAIAAKHGTTSKEAAEAEKVYHRSQIREAYSEQDKKA